MSLTCERVKEVLSASHDGVSELTTAEWRHVEICASCARFGQELPRIHGHFDVLRDVAAPRRLLHEALRQRSRAGMGGSWRDRVLALRLAAGLAGFLVWWLVALAVSGTGTRAASPEGPGSYGHPAVARLHRALSGRTLRAPERTLLGVLEQQKAGDEGEQGT